MANAKYISLILLLIVVVTLVNLFYKPWIYDSQPIISQFLQRQFASPVTRSSCALYGLKCEDGEVCDCEKLCANGEFVPFRVLPNETYFLMNHQLTPGTYCLPKGIGNCNQTTSYHVFSLAGWKCINRNKSLYQDETIVACKAAGAQDNSQNVLWDFLNNEPAKDIEDPYETLFDGETLRYRCVCDSLDLRSQPMVSVLPFTCSVDYCTANIVSPLPNMGFHNDKCECLVFPHQDPNDETSPCMMESEKIEDITWTGVVECMTDNSWKKSPIFCPLKNRALLFETPVMGGKLNDEFVSSLISLHDKKQQP